MANFGWVGPATGSWNTAANWGDNSGPASGPPGAGDNVSITSSSGEQVITGSGAAASLTLSGGLLLAGDFQVGELTVDQPFIFTDTPNPWIAIDAGHTLTVTGDAGPPVQITSPGVTLNQLIGADVFMISGAGAQFDVGGTLTLSGAGFRGNGLTLTDGGRAMVGGLSTSGAGVSVDNTSSLEVGALGDAAPGSVTIDPGGVITVASPFNSITAAAVVDNGLILANHSGLSITAPITGTGVIEIFDGDISVEQVGPGVTIRFDAPIVGGDGGDLGLSPASLDAAGVFGAALTRFAPGDIIGMNAVVTQATWANDTLTLSDGAAVVARLHVLGEYTGATFQVTPDGIEVSAGPARDDFSHDGISDVLIENASGAVAIGGLQGGVESYAQLGGLGSEWSFHGVGDFAGDGGIDLLIENTSGAVVLGAVAGGAVSYAHVGALGPEWSFHGTGDFLGDGKAGFLIEENTQGAVDVGEVHGGAAAYTQVASLGAEWRFVGTGDFLGDGKSDFLIENTAGAVAVGEVGTNGQAAYTQVASLGAEWKFVGAGDFLGDGKSDFLIQNSAGAVVVGEVGAGHQASYTQIVGLGPEWKFVSVGDYLGEGHAQFLIENASGAVVIGDYIDGAVHFTQVSALGSEWSFH